MVTVRGRRLVPVNEQKQLSSMGACGQRCPSQTIDDRCKHRCPTVVHFLHRCFGMDIDVWVQPATTVRRQRRVPVNDQKQLASMFCPDIAVYAYHRLYRWMVKTSLFEYGQRGQRCPKWHIFGQRCSCIQRCLHRHRCLNAKQRCPDLDID